MAKEMSKCKNCHCDCHCNGELHADDYGVCTCDNCKCKGKRTYKYAKDHGLDMSFENEIVYDKWKLLCFLYYAPM